MKALVSIRHLFMLMLVMSAAGLVSTACSNKDTAEKVAEKIENGETLSQGDYTCLIEYLGNFAEKAQPVQDKINNLPAGDAAAEQFSARLSDIKEEFPLVDKFNSVLGSAKPEEIGADNVALVDKYAGYEWFTAPSWAVEQTDPEAAGIELESPSSDTGGVVAGAVDEVKVKFTK